MSVFNNGSERLKLKFLGLSGVTAVFAIIFLAPFYFVFVNSFKEFGEILRNAASFPKTFVVENYTTAWETTQFPLALLNSTIVTVLSITLLSLLGAMAAWRLARAPHRLNRFIYFLFVAAMVVPFQTVMIPMVTVAGKLQLLDSRLGLVVLYLSFGVPFTVFLLYGFVQSIRAQRDRRGGAD